MVPIIPIIMAVAALGKGIVQGISNVKNAKAEANAIAEQLQTQSQERARQAKKLMQQQKTSFLKSGVYFDSGSPLEVINETYDFMNKDITDMQKDANANIKNLMRQGKTAFFSSLLGGAAEAGLSYFMAGGQTSNLTSKLQNYKIGSKLQNLTGNYRGGFGSVQTGGNSSAIIA